MTRVGILLLSLSVAFCALPLSTFVSAESEPLGDPANVTITPSAMGSMVISLPDENQTFAEFKGAKIENNMVDTYVSSEITVSNTNSDAPDYAKNSFTAGYSYKVSVNVTAQTGYQFSDADSTDLLGLFTYSNGPMPDEPPTYSGPVIDGSVEATGFTVSANVTMPGSITPRAISNSAVNLSISSLPAAGTKVSDFIAQYFGTDADNHYSYAMKVMTEGGVEVPGTESFEATNKYKFEIKATAENGYKFYDATTPEPAMFFRSVNWAAGYEFRDGGSPTELPQGDFDTSDYKWFSVNAFNKTNLPDKEPTVITPSAIDITIPAPAKDASIKTFIDNNSSSSNTAFSYAMKVEQEGNVVTNSAFKADTLYTFTLLVEAKDGYKFNTATQSEYRNRIKWNNDYTEAGESFDNNEFSVTKSFTIKDITPPSPTDKTVTPSAISVSIPLPNKDDTLSDFISSINSFNNTSAASTLYTLDVDLLEGSTPVTTSSAIKEDTLYSAAIKISLKDDYVFDADKTKYESRITATGYNTGTYNLNTDRNILTYNTFFKLTKEDSKVEVGSQNFSVTKIADNQYNITASSSENSGYWNYYYLTEANYNKFQTEFKKMIGSETYTEAKKDEVLNDLYNSSIEITKKTESNLNQFLDLTTAKYSLVKGIILFRVYTSSTDEDMSLYVGGCLLPTLENKAKGDEITGNGDPYGQHTYETNWSYDETNHFHKAICHPTADPIGVERHEWSAWSDVTGKPGFQKRSCNICGYSEEKDSHEHTYSNTWSFDAHAHWHAATCGHDVTKGSAPHTYGPERVVTPPTATTTGTNERFCTVCNYRNVIVTPATGNNNNNNYYPNNTNTPTTNSIINSLNNAAGTGLVTVSYDGSPTLQSSVFDALRNTNKTLELISPNGGATWIFNGADIRNASKDINLNVSVDYHNPGVVGTLPALINTLVNNNAQTMVVTFANNGVLPGKATIRLPLTADMISYMGSSGLYVYYVNEQTRLLELIASNLSIQTGNNIEFSVTHNSTFIITKGPAPTSSVAANTNNITNVSSSNSINSTLTNPNEITMIPSVPWNETFIAQNENNNNTNNTQQPQNADDNANQSSPATMTGNTSQPSSTTGTYSGTTATRAPRTDDSMMMYFWLIAMITGIGLLAFALLYLGRYSSYGKQAVNQRQQDIRTYRQAERYLEKFFA